MNAKLEDDKDKEPTCIGKHGEKTLTQKDQNILLNK